MSAAKAVVALIRELNGPQRPAVIASIIGATYTEHIDGEDATVWLEKPSGFPPGSSYQIVRTIADGDLCLTHGLLTSPDRSNSIAFDLWKLDGNTVVERWFSRAPEVQETASGHSQLDGAVEVDSIADTAVSKQTVTAWTRDVLLGGDLAAVSKYISELSYEQHNPDVADGIDGFAAAVAKLGEAGLSFDYRRVDIVIAEGDFVFTRALGNLGPAVVFNDLWRIAEGKIVEHWDVVSPLIVNRTASTADAVVA
jgi:predicted SnoaL-like aldol condensation-catalyzing enzyme